MKHTIRVTLLLLSMFLIAQCIGLYVSNSYLPTVQVEHNATTGENTNKTIYNLPYGFNPPEDVSPASSVISIMIAIVLAVILMFTFMRLKAEVFLRIWFGFVVMIGIALALNAFIQPFSNLAAIISVIIALPLAFMKIYRRNIVIHNLTELLIYPGIAAVFIPLLNVWAAVALLILISLYDAYAVWHAGFMQKMAKYQIEKLRVFSGFFIPYIKSKDRLMLSSAKNPKLSHKKGVPVQVAILGGGDVVFPIIVAGVVLRALGILPALCISIGATLALAVLFYFSEKGKFYPAMPFISVGCLIGLATAYAIA